MPALLKSDYLQYTLIVFFSWALVLKISNRFLISSNMRVIIVLVMLYLFDYNHNLK